MMCVCYQPHTVAMKSPVLLLLIFCLASNALQLEFLDPKVLQTQASAIEQQAAATQVIEKYLQEYKQLRINVVVNPTVFEVSKNDQFHIQSVGDELNITASTGIAAVWGFNYYLKKYCNSHIGWQVKRIECPEALPRADEQVTAKDRFRIKHNPIAASYISAWWGAKEWTEHVDWMALNGINIAYAPVAEEAAWANIYRKLGMTQEEIDRHFSGPAFLAWLRWDNVHGLLGPLTESFLRRQLLIQQEVVEYMRRLGMIPLFPAFNGHVPKAFSRIFPNATFHKLGPWFSHRTEENCCNLFVDPKDALFETIGLMFLRETALNSTANRLYTAEPFIHIRIETQSFSTFVADVAQAIYSTLTKFQERSVWVVQNTMFIKEPWVWSAETVKGFLTSAPSGRMLVLDLEAEGTPFYERKNAYHGQPFIWCMMQSWGGKFGMYGSLEVINKYVYSARNTLNSAMIGIGISPAEGDQNYVAYDLMLESAWREEPVNLEEWVAGYARRRYGCNATETATAWRHLLRSVYNHPRKGFWGHTILNKRPSSSHEPKTWFTSRDLFEAFKKFVFAPEECNGPGFSHDLVEVTRQAMQYRAQQLYIQMKSNFHSTYAVFKAATEQFLDVLNDLQLILSTHDHFSIIPWLQQVSRMATNREEDYMYTLNAKYQVTQWADDYACKQWAELYDLYYIPRWQTYIDWALEAKRKNLDFYDTDAATKVLINGVERQILTTDIRKKNIPYSDEYVRRIAEELFRKWAFMSLKDLPT